jgi:hypothetical protein
VRHHPELLDSQIARLIGTTKQTIAAVRDRSHWNSPNLRPRDPVLLGLCTQTDLNNAVARARRAAERSGKPRPTVEPAKESRDTSKMPGGFDISQFMPKPAATE